MLKIHDLLTVWELFEISGLRETNSIGSLTGITKLCVCSVLGLDEVAGNGVWFSVLGATVSLEDHPKNELCGDCEDFGKQASRKTSRQKVRDLCIFCKEKKKL